MSGEAMVGAADIQWRLEPLARLEHVRGEDLLALEPHEVLTYAADC
jgi:hypothetical protein